MLRQVGCVLTGIAILAAAPASARESCSERVLPLRFSPQAAAADNWCWAASGQMIMELFGEEPSRVCQCRQAEEILGTAGCCAARGGCVPAESIPRSCDQPRWPAFVENPERYPFDYKTTCDALPGRQADETCEARPLGWQELTAEICVGYPVIASLRHRGSTRGHSVVVKGFSTWPYRRVLVVDPRRLCSDPPCEGQLGEGSWISYAEYAAGWGGMVHWVDFYAIRRR